MQRFTVHFSGDVQGVGFRWTAARIAERFSVTGYVKNLHDGRVELVAEGEEAELQSFLDAVKQSMADYVQSAQVNKTPADGSFRGFAISRG
jgi:acylphosphatase